MSKMLLNTSLAALSLAVFNTDALADLGLNFDAATPAPDAGTVTDEALLSGGAATSPAVPAEAPVAEAKKARVQVAIAPLEFGTIDIIPAQKVGGAKGSKYEFDKLVAPVAKEDGSGYNYSYFLAKPEDDQNFDEDAFKRSVQSASTAANRNAKKDGTEDRYLTRQHIVKGEFVGVLVLRVDGTVGEEAEEVAEETTAE